MWYMNNDDYDSEDEDAIPDFDEEKRKEKHEDDEGEDVF